MVEPGCQFVTVEDTRVKIVGHSCAAAHDFCVRSGSVGINVCELISEDFSCIAEMLS